MAVYAYECLNRSPGNTHIQSSDVATVFNNFLAFTRHFELDKIMKRLFPNNNDSLDSNSENEVDDIEMSLEEKINMAINKQPKQSSVSNSINNLNKEVELFINGGSKGEI